MSDRRVMIVIGQVLVDPWITITREGQMGTWLTPQVSQEFTMRHSHGRRLGPVMRSLDTAHEWLRWHGRGRTLVPPFDAAVGRGWLNRVQAVEQTEFVDGQSTGWSQDIPDMYALQRWKVIGSLTMAMREEFDFVYFTTASSYVRPQRLLDYVSDLPLQGAYAGTPMTDGVSGVAFASGASRIMSRDVVADVLRHRGRYRNDVMEDVGLGRLIGELGYSLIPWPSLNVDSYAALETLTDEDIRANFHFRMTSGSRKARQDVPLMHALHRRVQDLEGTA